MKIAMLGHKRIPSREGGVEIVVEEIASRMVEKGHSLTVYNRSGHHVAGKENDVQEELLKEYKGIKIVTVKTLQKKSLNAIIYSFFATIKACRGHFDVIHFHAEGPCSMLWLPKLLGKKTIATIHGLDWQRAKWGGFATNFLLFGEKMAVKYADEIIVLSENVKVYFNEKYNRKTHYIPNGIAIPNKKEPNKITKKYGLQGNDYILFLARIVPEKGLHYLLEAYAKVDTDKRLVIAGGSSHSDEYMERIKKMAREDKRVIMTGFVQGEELEELYSNCLLYVLPSDIEGMPISLLEALSYGRNCLVSDIAENKEVVRNLGNYFLKGNIESLQEKLSKIVTQENKLEQNEKNNRMEEIREYVANTFSWDETVKRTVELYENSNDK